MANQTMINYLNYDFLGNITEAKSMLPNIRSAQDRINVTKWLHKLSKCNTTPEEGRLRNDFMYLLMLNLQDNIIEVPFCDPPPSGSLLNHIYLLPPETFAQGGENLSNPSTSINYRSGGDKRIRRPAEVPSIPPFFDKGDCIALPEPQRETIEEIVAAAQSTEENPHRDDVLYFNENHFDTNRN